MIDILEIPGTNQSVSGEIIRGVTGEDVEFGQVVYLGSDSKWYKAAAVYGKCPAMGMVVNTTLSGLTSLILLRGFARNDSWEFGTDIGNNLYLNDAVAGELTANAPNNGYNQIIGTFFLERYIPMMRVIYFNPVMI